jgi:uncharacterized membrane protein
MVIITNKETALKIVSVIAVVGIMFSGYLSYNEIFTGVCAAGGSCPSVYNIPACVYGLIMYIIVLVISTMGLQEQSKFEKG